LPLHIAEAPRCELLHGFDRPARAGDGYIRFSTSRNKTYARTLYAVSPLRLLNPRNHGHASWIYSSTFGGGLVGGDALNFHIDVDAHAAGMLATQASTKVYRSVSGVVQNFKVTVGPGGIFVAIPDPTVCFKDSQLTQNQSYALTGDAGLVVFDWITSGREANGERWLFRKFANRIKIFHNDKLILTEALLLSPDHGSLLERLGRFNVLALAIACGPKLKEFSEQIQTRVRAEPLGKRPDLLCVASPFRNSGLLLRVASTSIEAVAGLLKEYFNFVPDVLGDNPWTRRW